MFENERSLISDHNSGMSFGVDGHLSILGYYREGKYNKKYVVECSICKLDPELFKLGRFITSLGHLRSGKLPCGCSSVPKWTKDQQVIRVNRIIQPKGCYLSAMNVYEGQYTKVTVCCKIHGCWETSIAGIINNNFYCKECNQDNILGGMKKPDHVMIKSFMNTGVFHKDTKFERSSRKTSQGARNYWKVYCPVCDSKGEATSSDLRRGYRPCNCYKNPKFSYINLVKDGDNIIAIKFGITSNFKDRLFRQNLKSVYKIENYGIWEFPSKDLCYRSELEIKQKLLCGILSRQEMLDGFTETTFSYNLEKIIEIFESFGGIRAQF